MNMRDTSNRFLLLAFGATIFLLFAVAILVPKGDEVIFINGQHTPFLDGFFSLITKLGDGLIFVPIIFLFAFFRFQYSLIALVAWIFHGILSTFFKRVVFSGQLRPKELIDNSLLYFVPGVEVHSNFSFPSGHSMTIFCAAFLMGLVFRNRLVAVASLMVALLVGCSRIYLLQHFLIDVAGGALIGTFSAFVTWEFFLRRRMPECMSRPIKV